MCGAVYACVYVSVCAIVITIIIIIIIIIRFWPCDVYDIIQPLE